MTNSLFGATTILVSEIYVTFMQLSCRLAILCLLVFVTILHLTQALEMSDLEYISDEVDIKPCQTTPLAPSDFNEQQEVSAGQLLNPCPPPKESAWSKGPQGLVKRSKLVCSWFLSPFSPSHILSQSENPQVLFHQRTRFQRAWSRGTPPPAIARALNHPIQ